jgi:RNA polymerase sigma-70 factor (ECF subfamily)
MEASDHSLLGRYRAGSEDAAAELYRRYAGRLLALAKAQCSAALTRQTDVEDIVQSVFGSFFRGANCGTSTRCRPVRSCGVVLVIALNKIRARSLPLRRQAR